MSRKAKIEEIKNFLREFKDFMMNKPFRLVPRDKNMEFIEEMNITPLDVMDIIHNRLDYRCYAKGPAQDEKRKQNNVWTFGYGERGRLIYIKLSDDFRYVAKCISFHEAEFNMDLPYKKEEEEE